MILYFADRELNIIGQASTALPDGLTVVEDKKTEEVETGVSVFECSIPFEDDTRAMVEACAEVGNYLLRSHNGNNEFYQIIEAEIDTKRMEVYIYAEDDGMDLLNDVHGAYAADAAYPIAHYINKYAACAGFEIGINEVPQLTRKLRWDGEATATARIASVATQFDGCEVSYSFAIEGLCVTKKYINIYKKRGKDVGTELRLHRDIDRIVTTKTISNLATALQATGGTPEDDNLDDNIDPVPITLKGYSYDDGDFYVDEDGIVKSRNALNRWRRVLWRTDDSQKNGGHIIKQYSYDTLSQDTLCKRTITELKKICDMEVNYEADINNLPDDVRIGDRINIVDDAGELYLSTRILVLKTSVVDQTVEATLGEHLIKSSGISQKVADLAAQFATEAAAREEALRKAAQAKKEAEEAARKAEQAEKNLQAAQVAAEEAREKAIEAQAQADAAAQAAAQALADAADAKAETQVAQSKAETAITKAETAQSTAEAAKTEASTAKTTADAAKLDAEKAAQDIAALGENLETVTTTMQADYARKTDLTEATASLQSQITQNAAQISSTVSKVATIDETVNDAKEQAQTAQETAGTAKAQAEQAIADAQAAQTAATNAATAAQNAQSEADTAKAAAEAARQAAEDADSKADQAAEDLEAAKQNLQNVTSRVDATAEEVAAAQAAVEAAQAAADKAKQDAEAAQATADAAKADAETAQRAADDAQTAAGNAQAAAEEAQRAADEAQAAVDSLAVRVTTAETKITQNAEQIALRAKKTEVAETLGGYYTKEETEAAILIESDKITSSVAEAQTTASDAEGRVTIAESQITQLADMIATLVTDGNGASLMTQTENGWTFSIGGIVDSLTNTAENVDSLSEDVDGMNSSLDSLQQALNDLGVLADYVIITTYNGQPCIELGEGDNDFKLRITNTEIQFADGTTIPAYVSNKKLMIEQAEVKDELQFGGFVWKIRSNGNMGLMWKGVTG